VTGKHRQLLLAAHFALRPAKHRHHELRLDDCTYFTDYFNSQSDISRSMRQLAGAGTTWRSTVSTVPMRSMIWRVRSPLRPSDQGELTDLLQRLMRSGWIATGAHHMACDLFLLRRLRHTTVHDANVIPAVWAKATALGAAQYFDRPWRSLIRLPR